MAKGTAHQKQSKAQLEKQRRQWVASLERYYGKLALLQTYESLKIENAEVRRIRNDVRRQRVLLENKGAL